MSAFVFRVTWQQRHAFGSHLASNVFQVDDEPTAQEAERVLRDRIPNITSLALLGTLTHV
jgi:hypothetical protein